MGCRGYYSAANNAVTSTLVDSMCLALRKHGIIAIKLLRKRNKRTNNNVKRERSKEILFRPTIRGKKVYVWIKRLEGEPRDSRWLEWKNRLSLCLTVYILVNSTSSVVVYIISILSNVIDTPFLRRTFLWRFSPLSDSFNDGQRI